MGKVIISKDADSLAKTWHMNPLALGSTLKLIIRRHHSTREMVFKWYRSLNSNWDAIVRSCNHHKIKCGYVASEI